MGKVEVKTRVFSSPSLDEAVKMYYDKNALITIGYNSQLYFGVVLVSTGVLKLWKPFAD